MKKIFMILGSCLMAALVVIGCSKPSNNNQQKPDGGEQKPDDGEQKPDEGQGGEKEFSMDIAIDGDFSEWDTLTDETADGEYYLFEENTNAELNSMLRLKLASDEDNIYVYTEINYETIYVAEGGPYSQGGSWTGFLPKHPATPGALIIYLSTDDDASGAFAPVANSDGDSYWDYTGFDAFPQFYFCYDVAANKMQFGWQQNNWPQNHEDGWEKDGDKWGAPLSGHGAGWWGDTQEESTSAWDNTVSDENTFKFSDIVKVKDPVSKADVSVIKMEFAMDREAINEDGTKVNGSVVIGAFYENVDQEAHQTNIDGSGKLPSSNKALTLKLK